MATKTLPGFAAPCRGRIVLSVQQRSRPKPARPSGYPLLNHAPPVGTCLLDRPFLGPLFLHRGQSTLPLAPSGLMTDMNEPAVSVSVQSAGPPPNGLAAGE